jgi:signal transduction histidine kinase
LTRVVESQTIEAGEIFLREGNERTLRMVCHRGKTLDALWMRDNFQIGEGLVGLTAKTGQPRFLIIPAKGDHYLNRTTCQGGLHQVACFPLTGRSGILGVMSIATCDPKLLDEREIQLLSAIGSWVGTAIENVRLNIQGRRMVILEERERIGMDLHDGIIQSIYAVGLTLEHARLLMNEDKALSRQRIDQAITDLNSTIKDIRTYILDLRPRQLHEENLMDGLLRLVNEFRANTRVEATLSGPREELDKLSDSHAITLFHICQEALANVAKHAHAHKVSVVIWTTAERVLMEISDDGQGFDVSKINSSLGHGMSNIQTRVHQVGGDVEITSDPGQGTTILAWVPYLPSQESAK